MSVAAFMHFGDPAHSAFLAWLAAGASGEPDPEAASHAMSCDSCRNAIVAVDSLQAMDTGRVDLPAVAAQPPAPAGRWRWARHVFPATAVLVLAAAQIAGSGTAVAPGTVAGNGSPNFWQLPFVRPAPITPTSPSSSPTASDSSGPITTSEQEVQPGQGIPPEISGPGVTPGLIPGLPPGVSPPGVPGSSTPPSSSAPVPSPPPATAPPATPRPTLPPPPPTPPPPPPTPPPPTPEPTLSANCSDGIDNDGDLLVDLLDPGCLLLGGDEFAL